MKNKVTVYALLLSCVIASCNNVRLKSGVNREKTSSTDTASDTTEKLLSLTFLHPFSDPVKNDTFKLVMTGRSIGQGKISFEIVSFENKTIYLKKYQAYDLLGDLELPTAAQQEDTIKARFNTFFSTDAFSKPALERPDSTDTDYVDLETQKDISADATAIGFIYSIGYETTLEIAYSKRKSATVVCYASD